MWSVRNDVLRIYIGARVTNLRMVSGWSRRFDCTVTSRVGCSKQVACVYHDPQIDMSIRSVNEKRCHYPV